MGQQLPAAPLAWSRKAKDNDARPWTPEEDQKIIDAALLGGVSFGNPYKEWCPDRRYGDLLERRNQLKEAGRYTPPKLI